MWLSDVERSSSIAAFFALLVLQFHTAQCGNPSVHTDESEHSIPQLFLKPSKPAPKQTNNAVDTSNVMSFEENIHKKRSIETKSDFEDVKISLMNLFETVNRLGMPDQTQKRAISGLAALRPVWGTWSDWSSCSVSCGKGRLIRWRPCRGTCEGLETEMEEKTCQLPACGGKLFGLIKL